MTIQEKFKAILAASAFDQLVQYTEPVTWDVMSHNERELLGLLFVKQGEHQLKNGDSKVVDSFEIASKVGVKSPLVFFHQAMVYASQGQNIRCLNAAAKALEKAVHLDPSFTSAWHSWGNVLVRSGLCCDDTAYLYQADEKFHQVEHLLKLHNSKTDENLYWHWGVCWYHIGKNSGEAVDLFRSLERFRLAEKSGSDSGEFHNDYGNVLVDLGCLVSGGLALYLEAIEHYKKFIDLVSTQYEGWLNLACTYQKLYNLSGNFDYFYEANECFEHTSELNSEDATMWMRWGELQICLGKNMRDINRIQASVQKFEKANQIEPDHPQVLLRWGEAEMVLASYAENLELLHSAKNKIMISLEALPEDCGVWHVYGICLSEFGRYFAAEEYYKQAIEKFNCGLKFNGSHLLLLHGIALAYFSIGELNGDMQMMEQSAHYFQLAFQTGSLISSQILSDWGVALMKLGEMSNEQSYIEAAAEKFELAIGRRLEMPGEEADLELLYNYGCAMDFLGDFHEESVYYEKAVEVLAHILQIDPDYHHARYNLALALYHLGELKSDVESFQKAIDLFHELVHNDPEDEAAWNEYGLALLNLAVLTDDPAQAQQAQQLFEQAENKFLQAIALGNVFAYYNLACYYALTDNPSASIHYIERAEQCEALPSAEDVMQDEWLENLRNFPPYRLFISRLLNKEKEE